MYFLSNSLLLKFFSSIISDFSCCLTSAFSLLLNLATTFFTFSRFSFFSQVLCSTVNLFNHTKYFTTSLIFIFSTFYSSTLFTSTGFTSSTFCSLTYSLYCTTQLIFTIRWIFIEVSNCSLITLVKTILSMIYGPMCPFTSFLASFSNIKSFVLSITLSSLFHSSTFFLPLSACHFISSYAFLNASLVSSYTFFIFSANSVIFSNFSFLLIFAPILSSLL